MNLKQAFTVSSNAPNTDILFNFFSLAWLPAKRSRYFSATANHIWHCFVVFNRFIPAVISMRKHIGK
jgi:hypothetical protein